MLLRVLALIPPPALPPLSDALPWLPGVLLLLAVIAFVVLWGAWRGSRRRDGQSCRTCGYDLRGRPADSNRCSECGSDLAVPDAVALTRRHRRPVLALVLLPVAIAAVVASMVTGRRWAETFNWWGQKPTAWVAADTYSKDWRTAGPAVHELARRAALNTLDAGDVPAVVAAYFDSRRNQRWWWSDDWAATLTDLRVGGKLSDADWQAYGDSVAWPVLRINSPQVGVGQSPECEIQFGGAGGQADVDASWVLRSLMIDGQPVANVVMEGNWSTLGRSGQSKSSSINFPLPQGRRIITAVVDVAVSFSPRRGATRRGDSWRETVTLSDAIDVVRPRPPEPAQIAAARPAMLAGLKVTARRVPQGTEVDFHARDLPMAFTGTLVPRGLPAARADDPFRYQVRLRSGNGEMATSFTYEASLPSPLELELRPDPNAGNLLDNGPVWPEVIVLPPIPIAGPATRP